MDRIFKAVSEEVAASPRFMQELFKLNYERKRARYQEGYCSPFLDRYRVFLEKETHHDYLYSAFCILLIKKRTFLK